VVQRPETDFHALIVEERQRGEGEERVTYEVKKRDKREIEAILREWIDLFIELGWTDQQIEDFHPVLSAHKYSISYLLKTGKLKLSRLEFEQHLLKFNAFKWQRNVLDKMREKPDRNFMLNCGRAAGKSYLCGVHLITEAFYSHGFPWVGAIIAQNRETAGVMFTNVHYYLDTCALLQWCVKRETQTEIELDTMALMQTKPAGTRGPHYNLLILDEVAFQEDDQLRAIEPTVAAKHGIIVAISTPNGRNNWFWDKWSKDASYEKMCYTSMASETIDPRWIEYQKTVMPDIWFRQEIMAEFIEWGYNAFTMEEINALFQNNYSWHASAYEEGTEYYAGLDIGFSPDESVLAIGHKTKYDHIVIDYYQDWSQIPYEQVYNRTIELMQAFKVQGIVVDPFGAKRGEETETNIPKALQYLLTTVKPSSEYHAKAYGAVKHYVETKTLHIPNQGPASLKITKQWGDLEMKEAKHLRYPDHPKNGHNDTYSAIEMMIQEYFPPFQDTRIGYRIGTIKGY
jgi:hypothetical protein